ncbi:SAM-dependent methyltransferase [Mycobacterium sp. MS1601]|uniref:class I SAM-dependent methyltransferase n=1 Tax=Mycobacterium sp. MS1601 TaxID=1936029 RepID=UPI00097973F4|nr:class I SAM-dependent methyltransferase [Mycobacterium sp. MS1601]AQA03346.1 SAM-dependent methyltransferase [Mycobacterium sp. MS1601]
MTEDWRELNHANWESRVPVHTAADGYDLAAFDDPGYLSSVVRYDLPRLGRLDGLDVVHLQCHIGTDTVSLARLGAASVTGLDFSGAAVDAGRQLAERAGVSCRFVEADLYDALSALDMHYDVVYTGIGAICWIPEIRRWAEVVSGLLKPGGRFFMREGHPVLWALDDTRTDGLLALKYPYFESGGGLIFEEETSYAGSAEVAHPRAMSFNHGLGEIVTALIEAGLRVTHLEEHREVPWMALDEGMSESPDFPGEFVVVDNRDRLPLTYTLQAVKPAG